ncbi:MAG: hypothetical protein A2X19_10360 [Bacteroidetes bacterium GWE2_39_28]|nr:MAG: hypothetical protein A2X19_10360 [Bacteroidetes bacterium GWE2_39_28]OFY13592.1 MAG: hypothetical protein A2X16_08020 [Bacteroidetes bacterium GWF2_39_10]OFZ08288.1 MAG: hypothetical protein A2322_01400 [Bacteroidetes bacterium RIFOXYB2_FULL_39_7]OFZ11750.1 MAG: hypothetical protein A2465_06020 [Bacteroidetes bacterium RIFOXYC2_FULL_39_11]HCT94934.1 hypothetical protein [Rikenellaceae bacterium]
MKRYLTFTFVSLVILTVFFIASCNKVEKTAELKAKEFLDAFFKIDYNAAALLCTEELAQELTASLKSIESLEAGVRDMVIKQTSEVKTQIKSVDTDSKKDTVIVSYIVILPSFPNGIENTLSLSKVDKEWKVVELGR